MGVRLVMRENVSGVSSSANVASPVAAQRLNGFEQRLGAGSNRRRSLVRRGEEGEVNRIRASSFYGRVCRVVITGGAAGQSKMRTKVWLPIAAGAQP